MKREVKEKAELYIATIPEEHLQDDITYLLVKEIEDLDAECEERWHKTNKEIVKNAKLTREISDTREQLRMFTAMYSEINMLREDR